MSSPVVGVDVGGSKILAVVIDPEEPVEILQTARVATPRGDRAIVEQVAHVVDTVSPRTQHPVGVGVAGLVDRAGVVWTSPNLPGVERLDLRSELNARLGRRVVVGNDADAAAHAEMAVGGGTHGTVLFVALGTGIGGAIVVDGTIRRGQHGFAGEFGHMTVAPGGVPCVCGRRGCWERYGSGAALERMARERRASGALPSTGDNPTATEIVDAARHGDNGAAAVLDEFANWVGLGIANLVAAVDPRRVILGGGVLDAGDVLFERITVAVSRSLFGATHRPDLELVPAALRSNAGAIGAGLLITAEEAPGSHPETGS